MRILFFTGGLEPGRDGVGDYTRLLADACKRLGHTCALAALNDSHVTAAVTADSPAPLLRLPARSPWPDRLDQARAFRDSFKPDWISLQLVPYALEKRGLLTGFAEPLQRLTADYPLHIMFHELWVGAGWPSPLRWWIVGWFQRRGIVRVLDLLRPDIVTTSNPVFVSMLRSLHIPTTVLPLFGNIPIEEAGGLSNVTDLFTKTDFDGSNRKDKWLGVFFGGLHREWAPEPFLGILSRAAQRAGKKIYLVQAGRAGAAGDKTWQQLEKTYGAQITFVKLGEQPAPVISSLLQAADFGIAASPWQLIGKSGTAAAMLDHGLPIIVTRNDFQPYVQPDQPPSADPLVHRCDDELEAKLVAGLPKRSPQSRTYGIARQLCARFQEMTAGTP